MCLPPELALPFIVPAALVPINVQGCASKRDFPVHHISYIRDLQAWISITLQGHFFLMLQIDQLDLPVKRNQAFIIKYFSKTREKFCDHILGEGQRETRKNILSDVSRSCSNACIYISFMYSILSWRDCARSYVCIVNTWLSPQAIDGDYNLQLLLAMTDLLASCSEGENVFIESVCQTVYSLEELLEILSDPFLLPDRKMPFARFLVWVYMNTGSDKFQTGASDLISSE